MCALELGCWSGAGYRGSAAATCFWPCALVLVPLEGAAECRCSVESLKGLCRHSSSIRRGACVLRSLGAGSATACRCQARGRVRFGAWVLVLLQVSLLTNIMFC